MRRFILLGIDSLFLAIATVGALWLRENLQVSPARLYELMPYVALTVAAGLVVLPIFGTHRGIWRFSNLHTFLNLSLAVVTTVLLAVACGFAIDRMEGVARSIPIIQILLAISFMAGIRLLLRLRQNARSATKEPALVSSRAPSETVLLHGINAIAELYIRSLKELAPDRVHLAGVLGRSDRHIGRLFNEVPVLGTPEQAAEIVRELAVHGVFVTRILLTTPLKDLPDEAREALRDVERSSDVVVESVVDRLMPQASPRLHPPSSPSTGGADLSLKRVLDDAYLQRPYWRYKRIVDAVVASTMLVAMSPVIVLIWFAVVLDVGRPAIFWQQRPGRFGKPFRVFKFRTMRAAHDALGNPVADADRTSVFGRLLRACRLDELPQLWNILVGQMSFIGPRPLLPVDQLDEHSARLAVAPGLTGWAQVNGGRDISPVDKAALDTWYIQNASFGLDARIAVLTVRMVLFGDQTDVETIRRAWRALGASAQDVEARLQPLSRLRAGDQRDAGAAGPA